MFYPPSYRSDYALPCQKNFADYNTHFLHALHCLPALFEKIHEVYTHYYRDCLINLLLKAI